MSCETFYSRHMHTHSRQLIPLILIAFNSGPLHSLSLISERQSDIQTPKHDSNQYQYSTANERCSSAVVVVVDRDRVRVRVQWPFESRTCFSYEKVVRRVATMILCGCWWCVWVCVCACWWYVPFSPRCDESQMLAGLRINITFCKGHTQNSDCDQWRFDTEYCLMASLEPAMHCIGPKVSPVSNFKQHCKI